MSITIITASNGFVLQVSAGTPGRQTLHLCSTIEDVTTLVAELLAPKENIVPLHVE